MAQRTGADGFIASRAKTRSVAGIAALLVAALLALSGCGGDSDSDTQEANAPNQTAGEQAGSKAPAEKNSSEQTSQGSAGSGSQDRGQQGAAKQGEPLTLPEGSAEPAPTPAERAQATVASIVLTSPSLGSGEPTLPAPYTCEGKNTWPALQWSGVPQGTQELTLFVMNSEPVGEELFFGWALAGLDPALTEIEQGKLPRGAIVGRNGLGENGYSICPPSGKAETFIFALYAYPQALGPKRGFDPFELRNEILGQAGSVGLMAAVGR